MDIRRPGHSLASSPRLLTISLVISALLLGLPGNSPRAAAALAGSPQDLAPASGLAALAFEPNAGQVDPIVRFLARSRSVSVFFTPAEVVLRLPYYGAALDPLTRQRPSGAVVRIRFEGANPAAEVTALGRLPGVVNYLRGSDPARWQTSLPTYAGIEYRELYPGIGLEYKGGAGSLKGAYTLAPGADPGLIRWRYEGADAVRVDKASGDLRIDLPGQPALVERAPHAWQSIGGRRVPVRAAYVIANDGTLGFAVGRYDHRYCLTIDPQLEYSTYLGGNSTDDGAAIAVDGEGNAYITGSTNSTDFPTSGPLQPGSAGFTDAFVVKLNPAGNVRVFATYLGGAGHDDAYGIAVDKLGNVLVAGETNSADWPVAGAIQATRLNVSGEGFLAKLTPMGSGLIFSTYLGGAGGAEVRGVATDAGGSIYVTGFAYGGFPLAAPYESRSRGGDAFVAKLDPAGSRLVYSTYLGGSGGDTGYGIAVDRAGNAFVTGKTLSADFPVANPYQAQCRPVPGATNCTTDAFVSELSADGSRLVYSTYLGSSGQDEGYSVALDEQGNIAVTGMTTGTDFPTVSASQPAYGGAQSDAFVTKLDPGGGQLVFSTYLGGSNVEYGTREAVAVDAEGRITVVGSTSSGDFPLVNPIVGKLRPGNVNAFVTQYTPAGAVMFSSYLGSDGNTAGASGVAVDAAGNAYVTGATRAADFPTLNPAQPAFGGGVTDAFATKIHIAPGIALRFSPPELAFERQDSGTTSPLQAVIVTNVSSSAVSIASATLAGANPLDFTIAGNACSAAPLAAGGTCEISATFSPRASGMRYATIALQGAGWKRSIPLIGFGAPTAELAPGALDFPVTKPNTKSQPLTETLRNVGLEPLTLGTVTITAPDASKFSIESDGCTNATIEAGGACDVTVSFVPKQIGQFFAKLVFASAVFDAPVTASLAGTGGTTPVLTVDRAEWGVCEGLVVRVHGANFPPSGQYRLSFDDGPLTTGATGSDGSFSTLVTIPATTGGWHEISAADTVLTTYHAEVPVRTPGTDLPVILIPGVSGSYLDAASDFTYVAPPDPLLAIPWPDELQLIPMPYRYPPGSHAWLDGGVVVSLIGGEYRRLDVLRLKTDGITPEPGWFGSTSDLKVGEILWEVNIGGLKKQDFYKNMRDFLRNMTNPDGSKRYSDTPGEGRNLYYFPYDWRKDIALTGPALDAMIDEARRTSHKDKVILLVHSMGGLVSRNYLLQYGTSKVDQFISMGTPYLGSPLVAKVLEAGDNWGIQLNILAGLGPGLHPWEAQKIAQNFTSSYELLPAPGYFGSNPWERVFDTQFVKQQSSINGQLVMEPLNYAQSVRFFHDRHNPYLSDLAETFRQRGMGDFSLLRGQLFHQRIMGINQDTIGGIVLSPRQVCVDTWFGRACVPLPEFVDVRWVLGDGSVPLHSALGTGWQNDKGWGDDERTYLVDDVLHCDLPGDPRIQHTVERMLRGQLCRTTNLPMPSSGDRAEMLTAVEPTPRSGVTGVQVVAAGTATLEVTDGQGRHTGAIEGVRYGADQQIPGSSYAMTPGGQSIALTGDGSYTLTLRGMRPDGAVSLRVDTLSNGAVTQSRIFESIPMTGTTVANVSLGLPGPVVGPTLAYQYDAGSPVREAPQLPPLIGAAAQDRLPPVTQITIGPNRKVTLAASDTGGSGVRRIFYSRGSGAKYELYTGPFPLTGCITAVAEDWAGNAEFPAATLPCLYLPLIVR